MEPSSLAVNYHYNRASTSPDDHEGGEGARETIEGGHRQQPPPHASSSTSSSSSSSSIEQHASDSRRRYGTFHGDEQGRSRRRSNDGVSQWAPLPGDTRGYWDEEEDDEDYYAAAFGWGRQRRRRNSRLIGLMGISLALVGVMMIYSTKERLIMSGHPSSIISEKQQTGAGGRYSFLTALSSWSKERSSNEGGIGIDEEGERERTEEGKREGGATTITGGGVGEGVASIGAVYEEDERVPSSLPPPNFLVIMTDDMGMYDIGFNNDDIYSPNLDALADSGVVIDRFYTQPLCTPARGAFLTGLYPLHTGTEYETVAALSDWGLAPEANTIADYLKKANYSTHLIGKWHLGHSERKYLPTSRGFDTYFGYLEAECHYYSHKTTSACSCMGTFYDLIRSTPEQVKFVVDNTTRSDRLYSKEAVRLIQNHDPTGMQPLYLQVNFQNAHRPLPEVNDKDYSEVETSFLSSTYRTNPSRQRFAASVMKLDEGRTNPSRQRFAASVMKLDEAVGEIMDALQETKLLDTTYIIFLSDNGACYQAGGLNLPYRGTKSHLWEGGVRTPSFLSGPLVPSAMAGQRYKDMFHVSDWAPTILDLAGIDVESIEADPQEKMDGVSHVEQLLYGKDEQARNEILLNFQNESTPAVGGLIYGKWKLLLNEANQSWYGLDDTLAYVKPSMEGSCVSDGGGDDVYDWLFDLEADPYETTNLASEYPEVVANLTAKIYGYLVQGVKSYYGGQDMSGWGIFESVGYIAPWNDDDKSYFYPPVYVGPFEDL